MVLIGEGTSQFEETIFENESTVSIGVRDGSHARSWVTYNVRRAPCDTSTSKLPN